MITEALVEHFPALDATGVCRSAFVRRVPEIDVSDDKPEVLLRLDAVHREVRHSLGMANWPLLTTEQIHGDRIALVDLARNRDQELAGYDGFITDQRHLALGVHVADCCAVYIVDPKTPAIGLVHSGKKGTALAIVAKAIEQMRARFGSDPGGLIVQLSPCIRPPHYEIDFAADIVEQCRAAGVKQIHDSGVCTACDLERYYSYRAEKGKTGRMLALLGLL
ncbi:MAG TPA: polyphenol oxidase family protein [Chthoniobacterales bacterium]|jgi:copper oxidase (laccase) domain-containing protein